MHIGIRNKIRRLRRSVYGMFVICLVAAALLAVSHIVNGRLAHRNAELERNMERLFPSCMQKTRFELTAYDKSAASCGKWARFRTTKMGTVPTKLRTVAVDPSIIPLGSIVFIDQLGFFVAEDTGSKVTGHTIDMYVEDYNVAIKFGRRAADVYYLSPSCVEKFVAGRNLDHSQEGS